MRLLHHDGKMSFGINMQAFELASIAIAEILTGKQPLPRSIVIGKKQKICFLLNKHTEAVTFRRLDIYDGLKAYPGFNCSPAIRWAVHMSQWLPDGIPENGAACCRLQPNFASAVDHHITRDSMF